MSSDGASSPKRLFRARRHSDAAVRAALSGGGGGGRAARRAGAGEKQADGGDDAAGAWGCCPDVVGEAYRRSGDSWGLVEGDRPACAAGGGGSGRRSASPSPRVSEATPVVPGDEGPLAVDVLRFAVGRCPRPAGGAAPQPFVCGDGGGWVDFEPDAATRADWRDARARKEAEVPPYRYLIQCRARRGGGGRAGGGDDGPGQRSACACIPGRGGGAAGGADCVGPACVNRCAARGRRARVASARVREGARCVHAAGAARSSLNVECTSDNCNAEDALGRPCSNRPFRRGGHCADVDVRPTPGKGHGLFARAAIPTGTFIHEYAGEVLCTEEAVTARMEEYKCEGKTHLHILEVCVAAQRGRGHGDYVFV